MVSPLLASTTSSTSLVGGSADTSLNTNTNNDAITSDNMQGPLSNLFVESHDVDIGIDNDLRTTTLDPPASVKQWETQDSIHKA